MDCQEARNRIDAWVDGELSASVAERITRHLDACPTCRRHADALRPMTAALDQLPSLKAPALSRSPRIAAPAPTRPFMPARDFIREPLP